MGIKVYGANCLTEKMFLPETVYCPEIDNAIPKFSCDERQKDPSQHVCYGGCQSKGRSRNKVQRGKAFFSKEEALRKGLLWMAENEKITQKEIAEREGISYSTVHRMIGMARLHLKSIGLEK